VYRSGFGRFTNYRFTMSGDQISNNFVHLTNVAVQKTAPDYDEASGGKWDLASIRYCVFFFVKDGEKS
jgi:tubulin polyglutamylase TTLL9